MKKVMVVICTKDNVMKECLDAVNNQDYENYSTLIHIMKPRLLHDDKYMQQSLNVAENKETARKIALASDADYFFFIDSDVVIPTNAITEMVKQLETDPPSAEHIKQVEKLTGNKISDKRKKVIGGYYPLKEDPNHWVLGRFIGQGIMNYYTYVKPSLTSVHYVGCGCIILARDVLERLKWNGGIDNFLKNVAGEIIFADDSVDLCVQILKLGEGIWANGSVVCQHLA